MVWNVNSLKRSHPNHYILSLKQPYFLNPLAPKPSIQCSKPLALNSLLKLPEVDLRRSRVVALNKMPVELSRTKASGL